MYAQSQRTNGFAIASLVCAFVFSLLGLIFGIVALNQIKRTGEGGRTMALWGLWLSIIFIAGGIILSIALMSAGAYNYSVNWR
jgi:peptidyl-prolyl cis-trans isomerase B (cyclophilin B)